MTLREGRLVERPRTRSMAGPDTWRVTVGGFPLTDGFEGTSGLHDLGSGFFVGIESNGSRVAVSGDGGCGVVVAGHLPNLAGIEGGFASEPDENEAIGILRAYERWGSDAFSRLKGAFALAVWDRARGVVLGVRDPVGVHPLFYALVPGGVVVSPSMEDLLTHPSVSRDVNRGMLVEHLVARWDRPHETYYRDIRRVLAGYVLRITPRGVESSRYWMPAFPSNGRDWVKPDELDRFDALLERAVERCVGGRTGIFLSGGFDSVSIAAMAVDLARAAGEPPPLALSLGLPHPTCDEEQVQRGVAAGLGLPQVFLPLEAAVQPDGLLVSALRASAGWPAPMMLVSRPGYLRLGAEGRDRGCEVILTGAGGDDWLNVGPLHMADLVHGLDLARFWRLAANQLRSHRLPRVAMLRYLLWTSGLRPVLVNQGRRALRAAWPGVLRAYYRRRYLAQAPSWVAPDPELRQDMAERVEEIATRLAAEPEPSGPFGFYFHRFAESFTRTFRSMEMEEDFEAARRMGVPVRMPYWDLDLIDFLVRTPPDLLNQGGRSKGLVRASVARRFPQLGFERHRKVSGMKYYRELLLREGPGAWTLMGRPSTLIDLGVIDRRRIDDVLASGLASGQVSRAHRLWQVLNLEAWLRRRV